MNRKCVLCCFLLLGSLLYAEGLETIGVGTSLSYLIDETGLGASSDLVTSYTAGIDFFYTSQWYSSFDLVFKDHYYAYLDDQMVLESDNLYGDVSLMMNIGLSPSIGYFLSLTTNFNLRFEFIPAVEFIFPVKTFIEEQTDLVSDMLTWYYSDARFVYLNGRISGEYMILDNLGLELFAQFSYPLESLISGSSNLNRASIYGGFMLNYQWGFWNQESSDFIDPVSDPL